MISHKYKCIFIHIPKTGGGSIEQLLWPREEDRTEENLWMGFVDEYHNKYQTGGLQHLTAAMIRRETGDDTFRSYFKFSMVRNPWDKAVSQFAYMQKRPDLRAFIGMEHNDPFPKYLELTRLRKHVQWEEQYRFVYDEQGELLADEIGRYEQYLPTVERWVRKLTGSAPVDRDGNLQIPKINPGDRQPYQTYYTDETRERVAELYARDIELFGYRF